MSPVSVGARAPAFYGIGGGRDIVQQPKTGSGLNPASDRASDDCARSGAAWVAVLMPPQTSREALDFWLDQIIDWSTLSENLASCADQSAQPPSNPRTEPTS